MRCWGCIFITWLACCCLAAQQTTIRTSVPLVVLPTSVTDRKGHFIAGLGASDFIVLDDGAPRAIHIDDSDSETAPIAPVVAIQTSDISQSALAKIRKAGSMISQAVVERMARSLSLRSQIASPAGEYILPARFDDMPVPGMTATVAFHDLRQTTPPPQVASLIIAKLGHVPG